MADLLGASIPERGAASTLQELLLRSQPLPRSPLRHCSSSSCSEAAAMAAADSLLTPLESCKNVVRSSWHQVVRRRQASSGQPGHHGLWCGQPPSGAASAASRRPLPRGKRNVWGPEDVTRTEQEIGCVGCMLQLYIDLASSRLACVGIYSYTAILYSIQQYTAYSTQVGTGMYALMPYRYTGSYRGS